MIVSRRFRSLSTLLLVTASQTAVAQTPTPEASPTVSPFTYALPGTPSPTPASTPEPLDTPVPAAAATPRATPTPRVTPAPRVTPTPRASPTPQPRATATAEALPVEPAPSPTPTPTPATVATSLPTPSAVAAAPAPVVPAAADDRDGSDWLLPLGVVLALVAGGAWWWVRRRKDGGSDAPPTATFVEPLPETEVASDLPSESEPVAAVGAPRMLSRRGVAPVAPAPRAERAWIELELRPRRAGLNMLTATADVDIVVRNRGDADAANVRIDARLTSARADQDAELGQVFAETSGRSVTPAFTLVPGGERVVRALVTLPREAINVLTAANRPMFVPVVTLNARYAPGGGGEGQTAQAFALGIERAGAAKLAPFWLDAPTRMFEAVAARPHALSIAS